MKRDTKNTDAGPLSGKRNGSGPNLVNEVLYVTEERKRNAAVAQHFGNVRVRAEFETDRFTSGLTPPCIVEKPVSGRTPLEEAVENHIQSRRVTKYATADIVCREDPW